MPKIIKIPRIDYYEFQSSCQVDNLSKWKVRWRWRNTMKKRELPKKNDGKGEWSRPKIG